MHRRLATGNNRHIIGTSKTWHGSSCYGIESILHEALDIRDDAILDASFDVFWITTVYANNNDRPFGPNVFYSVEFDFFCGYVGTIRSRSLTIYHYDCRINLNNIRSKRFLAQLEISLPTLFAFALTMTTFPHLTVISSLNMFCIINKKNSQVFSPRVFASPTLEITKNWSIS